MYLGKTPFVAFRHLIFRSRPVFNRNVRHTVPKTLTPYHRRGPLGFKRRAMRLGVILEAFSALETATNRWPPQRDFSSISRPTTSDHIQRARAPIRTPAVKWKSRASTRKTLSGSRRGTLLSATARPSRKHQERSTGRASTRLKSLTSLSLHTMP